MATRRPGPRLGLSPTSHRPARSTDGRRGFGLRLAFASAVDSAAEEHRETLSVEDRDTLTARLERNAPATRGREVLWIDDDHGSTRNERSALVAAGITVETVTDTQAAIERLREDRFDVILSDIRRGGDADAGVRALPQLRAYAAESAFIFYVGDVRPESPPPVGAFGITDRPSELLHLVLDAVERLRIR